MLNLTKSNWIYVNDLWIWITNSSPASLKLRDRSLFITWGGGGGGGRRILGGITLFLGEQGGG